MSRLLYSFAIVLAAFQSTAAAPIDSDFDSTIGPFLQEYCIDCHGGEKVKGDVDFTLIDSAAAIDANHEVWGLVAELLEYGEMPPEEEGHRPTALESQAVLDWYQHRFVENVRARPAPFTARRLSAHEYRNTLRELLGFDLENKVMAAEQTAIEPSLILKLLPTDPPGASGYVNDTHSAPLSAHVWEQYAYLTDRALSELFSLQRRQELGALIGQPLSPAFSLDALRFDHAEALLSRFVPRALRRPIPKSELAPRIAALRDRSGRNLVSALKAELKALLVSPAFIYRGLMVDGAPGAQQPVDAFELAERLSYFLWENMPDRELVEAADSGALQTPAGLTAQIDRMLASPKARSLSERFGHQWLLLADIDNAASDVTTRGALRSQPLDFLHYLFTEDRPVIELIDSEVAFASYLTANYYPQDRAQLAKYQKPQGIERQLVPNQRIRLEHDTERQAGILTMPGILGMNRGPILRGTWMLRRILGEHLGEPPADVPPIEASAPNKELTFRERFERHRSDSTCARCHDKIDPLGFALQGYDDNGAYKLASNYKPPRRPKEHDTPADEIDTSGRFPTGESFRSFDDLKAILLGPKRRDVILNAVEQTLAYALCRKLEAYDRPTVDRIADTLLETDGTWRDLFILVAQSLPFQQTVFPEASLSANL